MIVLEYTCLKRTSKCYNLILALLLALPDRPFLNLRASKSGEKQLILWLESWKSFLYHAILPVILLKNNKCVFGFKKKRSVLFL